tara:strand:- start:1276 stop:1860 length:585 start_codon:yes stop_codon:yes gene_type:complete
MISIFIYKSSEKIKSFYLKFKKKIRNKIILQQIKNKGVLGDNVTLGDNVMISGFEKLVIGNNVHIGSGAFIRADGGLTIGNNVIISRNLVLYSNSHNYKGKLLPFDGTYIDAPVAIENNVWIGMNVTISPGTKIGEGAIIGLGTRLFGEISERAIIGSQSPKLIKYRDLLEYEELEKANKFGNNVGNPIENEQK